MIENAQTKLFLNIHKLLKIVAILIPDFNFQFRSVAIFTFDIWRQGSSCATRHTMNGPWMTFAPPEKVTSCVIGSDAKLILALSRRSSD